MVCVFKLEVENGNIMKLFKFGNHWNSKKKSFLKRSDFRDCSNLGIAMTGKIYVLKNVWILKIVESGNVDVTFIK